MYSIWFGKKADGFFKSIGLEVPEFPKQGDVTWKGEVVGYCSNFDGIRTSDSDLFELCQENASEYNLGCWNNL